QPAGSNRVSRAPPRRASSDSTVPIPETMPVNIRGSLRPAAAPDTRRPEEVRAHALAAGVLEDDRPLERKPGSSHGAQGASAAEDARRREDGDTVHEPGLEERRQGFGSPLDHHARDLAPPELREQTVEIHRSTGTPWKAPDFDAAGFEPFRPRVRKAHGGDND